MCRFGFVVARGLSVLSCLTSPLLLLVFLAGGIFLLAQMRERDISQAHVYH